MSKIITLVLAIGLISTALFAVGAPLKCDFLKDKYFEKIAEDIYVEKENIKDHGTVVSIIFAARERIQKTFGDLSVKLPILVTNSSKIMRKFGGNLYGVTHRSPVGSCIVLGVKGQNVDVVAHELMHAEVAERLGTFRVLTDLPVWFDEGFATLVDYREPYLSENMNITDEDIEQVKQLFWGHEFYSDQEKIVQRYQAAKLAVMKTIKPEDYMGIFARIEDSESLKELVK